MIKVLIVEDSGVVREMLSLIINGDPQLKVIDAVQNGAEALESIKTQRPDIITMDIVMPVMDGLEATRRIMSSDPIPIVIISSSWDIAETEKTFVAMDIGALAVLEKPHNIFHPKHDVMKQQIIDTIKTMSEVKLVRRRNRLSTRAAALSNIRPVSKGSRIPKRKAIRLLAIGASTGGPPVINTILSELPVDFPLPILLIQHISRGFLKGFAAWLNKNTAIKVSVATHGQKARPGHCYLAPDDNHMTITPNMIIKLDQGDPVHGVTPSVSRLFDSISSHFPGQAMVFLLTGMGSDGAAELKKVRDSGSITIIQDRESSVVWGMPGMAARMDCDDYCLPPEEMVNLIRSKLSAIPSKKRVSAGGNYRRVRTKKKT